MTYELDKSGSSRAAAHFLYHAKREVGSASVECAPSDWKSFMDFKGAKRATSLLGLSSIPMPSQETSPRLPSCTWRFQPLRAKLA